jgi:hypothetical protein
MPLVALTRLRLRSRRYLPSFLVWTIRSALQARAAKGSVAVSLLADTRHTYWTRTVWTDETSMRAYMISGSHRRVMPRLLKWCDEARVTHWTQETARPPPWEEVYRRILRDGRPSKLNHPSEAHNQSQVPEPVVSRFRELHFRRAVQDRQEPL